MEAKIKERKNFKSLTNFFRFQYLLLNYKKFQTETKLLKFAYQLKPLHLAFFNRVS